MRPPESQFFYQVSGVVLGCFVYCLLPPAFTVNDLQTPDAALFSPQSDNDPGTSNKFQLAIPGQSGDRENIH